MLKHTHNREIKSGNIKIAKKSIKHSIDISHVEIMIAATLCFSRMSDSDDILRKEKELKKLKAAEVERAIISTLWSSGCGYFDYYSEMPRDPEVIKVIKDKAAKLFPQLV